MVLREHLKAGQGILEFVIILALIISVALVGSKVFGPSLKSTLITLSNKIDAEAVSLVEKASGPKQIARLQNSDSSSIANESNPSNYTRLALSTQIEPNPIYSTTSSTAQPSMQIASSLVTSNTQPYNMFYSPSIQTESIAQSITNNYTASTTTTQQSSTITTSSAARTTSSTTSTPTSGSSSYSADYWAAQPTAVQALRNISDPNERQNQAAALAAQGYTIDVPIMVWDWDPQRTMELRGQYGYTWVPSALQPNVQIAPGLTMPGVEPYDADNPPEGSIAVPISSLPETN